MYWFLASAFLTGFLIGGILVAFAINWNLRKILKDHDYNKRY